MRKSSQFILAALGLLTIMSTFRKLRLRRFPTTNLKTPRLRVKIWSPHPKLQTSHAEDFAQARCSLTSFCIAPRIALFPVSMPRLSPPSFDPDPRAETEQISEMQRSRAWQKTPTWLAFATTSYVKLMYGPNDSLCFGGGSFKYRPEARPTIAVDARIFLGLTEAITFYLSLWYRRRDVASRVAIFFSAATIAGAFGGLLAYVIEKMEGIGGLHGWQWIFCLEGLVAFASYFYMHDYPETAGFLTLTERAQIVYMLKEDAQDLATHYDRKFVWQAMRDYKTYVQIGIYIGIPLRQIQPPRALHNQFLPGRASRTAPGAGYAGAILAAVGVYPTIAVDLAWAGSIAGGDVRKGVLIAMVIGFGNLGGICASFIYITPPYFHIGHGTIMGWLSLSIILSCFAMWDYNRINEERDAYCAREGIDASRRGEFRDMGSESPLFRYTI
ncbi:hypothetical protein B0H10DRAFT_1942316 [Mycena sp. CBHHK59/15]|nr:hypothetical protein B0H10DRAFT_1942316 [Mycena sp. CBHHK59/15]